LFYITDPMKYFSKELWAGYNSRSDAERQRAFEQGERNRQEYSRQLEQLRPRLSEKAYRFFTDESLHDGRLLAFSAGDSIGHDIRGSEKFDINVHKVTVEMRVLGSNLDVHYALRYETVRRVLFDYPSDEPLFHNEGRHIGDWGYDELTAIDDNWLRHEVLFASGTTILIEFKDFFYEREGCEGVRYL
jgi:hypothetical protein